VVEEKYYLISQVVESLQREFPDVTVSKVRYLDRIGILNLNRSQSGYRRFRQIDIDQLHWVLKQQQKFLPLKVIQEQLESGEWKGEQPSVVIAAKPRSASGSGSASRASGGKTASALATSAASGEVLTKATSEKTVAARDSTAFRRTRSDTRARIEDTTLLQGGGQAGKRGRQAEKGGGQADQKYGQAEEMLSLENFMQQSGLSTSQLRQLEEFKLFNRASRRRGYNRYDLDVAQLAKEMLPLGLEPRHLRIYALAAEREADLAQQLARPILARKNPQTRQEGLQKLTRIVELGGELQQILLKRLLNEPN